MRRTQPHLPVGPLVDYVERVAIERAESVKGQISGVSAVLRPFGDNVYRAYWRAKRAGTITVWQADRLACALGVHPCELWGEDWWADVDLDDEEGAA